MKKILLLVLFSFITIFSVQAESHSSPNKTIVFDFGGVIVHPDKTSFYEFIKDTFQLDEQSARLIPDKLRAARTEKIPESLFWLQTANEHNISLPEDWKIQYDAHVLQCLNESKKMRDIIKFYKELGYQIALLSNVTSERAVFLRNGGYYNDFSPVLLSCEIGVNKPDLRAYQIMLAEVNVSPENCIFIDDKQPNIDAAKSLGIDAILFLSPEQIEEELSRRLQPIEY